MEYYTEILYQLRKKHKYSQYKIAEYLDTSQTMYSQYELGKVALPIRHLIKLCKLYNVSSDYILGLNGI